MNGRGGYDIRRRRRREIESLVQYLGAGQTDDYAHFLMLWAQALPETAERMISLLQDASHRMRRRNQRGGSAANSRGGQNHTSTQNAGWLG